MLSIESIKLLKRPDVDFVVDKRPFDAKDAAHVRVAVEKRISSGYAILVGRVRFEKEIDVLHSTCMCINMASHP